MTVPIVLFPKIDRDAIVAEVLRVSGETIDPDSITYLPEIHFLATVDTDTGEFALEDVMIYD